MSDWIQASMLSTVDREAFDERAGIREFDGGMSRADAERAAMVDLGLTAVPFAWRLA